MKNFNNYCIFDSSNFISRTTSCFIQEKIDPNKIKEEILKFDNEYWKITDECNHMLEEINKSFNLISDKMNKNYTDYILKFKNLDIPDSLDEFYLKKLNSLMLLV